MKRKHFDYQKTILLFGEARSGTTWLMELISNNLDVAINWEPFHPTLGSVPAEFSLGPNPYLQEQDLDFNPTLVSIMGFQLATPWTRKHNRLLSLARSSLALIKSVRAVLLLPFINRNISLEKKPILLLRHPFDTCLSQIRYFGQHSYEFYIPDCRNNERFKEHFDYIRKLDTPLEKKIASWCINNIPVINDSHLMKELLIVHYHQLVQDPETVVRQLFLDLQLPLPKKGLRKLDLKSATAGSEFNSNANIQLWKNFQDINIDTRNRVQRIFDHFGLDLYNMESPLPLRNQP